MAAHREDLRRNKTVGEGDLSVYRKLLWNAEGGVPYKNKTNNKQKQAGERPETHRFARSKRVHERIVIGVKLTSAWGEFLWNYGLRSVILRM